MFFLGAVLSALVAATYWPYQTTESHDSRSVNRGETSKTEPDLWRIVSMTDEELTGVDIAYTNLLCATGLPGSESLNIHKCQRTLDEWAKLIQTQTEK